MAQILDIQATVVTGDVLSAAHRGEALVRVPAGAVITPSGWDYLRYHKLRLHDGAAAAASPQIAPGRPAAAPAATAGQAIAEVLPAGFEAGLVSKGRYDHPDRAYGCRTEEFGSGFVEPASCDGCAVKAAARTGGSCGCGGCNKEAAGSTPGGTSSGGSVDEALVQRLTDEIMRRLGQ
jgi:hypothetical protein